jgi:hypothetical protein
VIEKTIHRPNVLFAGDLRIESKERF